MVNIYTCNNIFGEAMPIHFSAGIFALGLLILIYDMYLLFKGTIKRIYYRVGSILIILTLLIYVYNYLIDNFQVYEVYRYSSRAVPVYIKLASTWSGNGGFLLWWIFWITLISLLYRYYLDRRLSIHNGSIRKFFFLTYLIIILLGFSVYTTDAFRMFSVKPVDGLGLNPLLRNYWNLLHPPSAIISYALAYIVATSIISKISSRFISVSTSLSWLFITIANILGGIWAYNTLGWGGYWAWDPVETGLLLPWLVLTAYFHSSFLPDNYRNSLLSLAGFSVSFAAYVTRGGVYSPLHGFTGVSPSGIIIMAIGIPFLLYSISELSKTRLEEVKHIFNNVYELSLSISSFSLFGIYIVLLSMLGSQSIYTLFTEENLAIDIIAYNVLSSPFVFIFLLFFPGCMLYKVIRDVPSYFKWVALPSSITSISIGLYTYISGLKWSIFSAPITNILISILLPITFLSLLATAYGLMNSITSRLYRDIGLKILHLSIPLLMISILISGPYAYNQIYFTDTTLNRDIPARLSGLDVTYLGAEFIGPKGSISIPGAAEMVNLPAIPEEVEARLYFRIGEDEIRSCSIKFNFGNILKDIGGIIVEPLIINKGLDEYYITISPSSALDLIYFYGKISIDRANSSLDEGERFVYSHIPIILSQIVSMNISMFRNHSSVWKPDNALLQSGVVISYKKVPLVSLLWISLFLLVIGEIYTIVDRWVIYREVV